MDETCPLCTGGRGGGGWRYRALCWAAIPRHAAAAAAHKRVLRSTQTRGAGGVQEDLARKKAAGRGTAAAADSTDAAGDAEARGAGAAPAGRKGCGDGGGGAPPPLVLIGHAAFLTPY
jgi:hypothetical protein